MNSKNTPPIGVRIDSAHWLAMPVHAARCAVYAAISSDWAHCDDSGARSRHRGIDAPVLRCRGAERRGSTAGRVRPERP